MKAVVCLSIAALYAGFLSACGSDTNVKVQGTTSVTKGQELTDLQKARDAGAIDQDDYERLQEIILKRDN